MDNNFISIDDLVRQRLEGGEEKERSGAWLQMKDLLDKEMPRNRPFGFIYWRRTLTYLGALLLLTGVTIGGYEISSGYRGSKNTGTANNSSSNNTNNPVAQHTTNIRNSNPANSNIADTKTGNNNNAQPVLIAANNPNNNAITNSTKTQQHKKHTTHSAQNNSTNSNANPSETAVAHNTQATDVKNVTVQEVSNKTNNDVVTNDHTSSADAKNNTHKTAKATSAKNKSNSVASGNTTKHKTETTGTAKNTNNKEVASATTKNKNTTHAKKHTRNTTGTTSMNSIALAGSLNSSLNNSHNSAQSSTPNSDGTGSGDIQNSNNNDKSGNKSNQSGSPALNTASNSPKSNTVQTTINTADNNRSTASKQSAHKKPNTKKTKNTESKLSNNKDKQHKNSVANNDNKVNNTDVVGASSNDVAATNKPSDSVAMKTLKLIRMENRYVKTSVNYGSYKLDTISIEEVQFPEYYKNIFAAASRNMANPAGNNESGSAETSDTAGGEVAQINPNASNIILAKPYTEKQAGNTDYKQGASAAEGLSKLFNDIKYNISGVHFAPGLTGGINATFFGPASLKGFQFGFQGNIVFNDNWSILAQLKYFHRINSGYTMYDNYDKYTPIGGGQYQKDSLIQTIGFTTLHSFELPLAIQYSEKHIVFSAGLNVAYSLAVNIDEAPVQSFGSGASSGTVVNSIGNDNAPKIKVGDFSSKIGLGYLLGISYKVAPDVTIDLRSVQTFWDNSKTPGAKMVSEQLYKNPSIQLSFGYTFRSREENRKDK